MTFTAQAWGEWRVPLIAGLADKRIETGEEFPTRALAALWGMAPGSKPKHRGLGFLPSVYSEHDAREHKTQRERGSFVALVIDVDKGSHSIEAIENAITGRLGASAWFIYSTANAHPDNLRWRAILPLAEPVEFTEWRDAQEALFEVMASAGIEVDGVTERAGQISYLPNVPAKHEGSGQPLRDANGPLYYAARASEIDAPGLPLDTGPIFTSIASLRTRREEDERRREEMRKASQRKRKSRPIDNGESLIDAFNRANPLADMLTRCGYEQSRRDERDWRSPFQTSGSFATRIIEDSWVSLSGSDASARIGEQCHSGCWGDSFDLAVKFEFGGDFSAALRAMAKEREAVNPRPMFVESETYAAGNDDAAGPDWHTEDEGMSALDWEAYAQAMAGEEGRPAEQAQTADPDGARTETLHTEGGRSVMPVDLWKKHLPPDLPLGLLPNVIERFALQHGDVMGADPAGLALAALTVCASSITDQIQVQVKRNDPNWKESARLWVALVGPPSGKKTPIMNSAVRPLRKIDGALMRKFLAALNDYEALKPDQKRVAARPKQERRMISDTTVEAAQEILKDSPRGVLSAQDELSGWFGAMEKYAPGRGSMAERGFWLQTFSGGEYNVARIARGSSYIPNCSVSLLGGIQPEPLRAIANDTHDDGLIQRLLPVILKPGRLGKDEPAGDVVAEYERLIEKLELMRPQAISHDYPQPLRFDDRARAVREGLEEKHHDQIQALEAISPKLAAHFGKYDGIFARLCVLWHCIEHIDLLSPPAEIGEPVALAVAGFMDKFLQPNAIAFYVGVLGLSDGHDQLMALASHIVARGLNELKMRDAQRSTRSMRHITTDEFRRICGKLEAFGWLEQGEPGPKSNTPRWLVNPAVHDLFKAQAAAERDRRTKAREALRNALAA